jgi:choline-sulfatase
MSINTVAQQNLLVIMSDEHSAKYLGCYGHRLVKTPHIDALAARGVRFEVSYTNSPVCIPARAVFATGCYVHQIGCWDNANPYDGSVGSWHHRLRDAGHRVVSIGKLHYRSTEDDNGFSEEIIPMHVVDGQGDLLGLIRDDMPKRGAAWKMARMAGPGESAYTFYDREIAARAQIWLREEAPKNRDKPWALFVSFVAPHFPLTAPPEHFYRYYGDPALPAPKLYEKSQRPVHPHLEEYGASFAYDEYFDGPDKVRRAVAGYFGLCSFLDENIGKIVATLSDCGLTQSTRVVYTSDHGDNLGARGVWGKSTMYEESTRVPLIMAGRDIPANRVCVTPTSQVDFFPTALAALGIDDALPPDDLPGQSLLAIATAPPQPDRKIFSEYHGMGSTSGVFMIRRGRFKYVYYTKFAPELFDLANDPEELRDLAQDQAYAGVLAQCHAQLQRICDPATVDASARRRQAHVLALNGGRDAVMARGDFGFSPPPGVRPDFQTVSRQP